MFSHFACAIAMKGQKSLLFMHVIVVMHMSRKDIGMWISVLLSFAFPTYINGSPYWISSLERLMEKYNFMQKHYQNFLLNKISDPP